MKRTSKLNIKPLVILATLSIALISGGGCVTKKAEKVAEALSKDNATVVVNLGTVYGTAKVIRTNPGTNQDVTISPDGTVSVKSH